MEKNYYNESLFKRMNDNLNQNVTIIVCNKGKREELIGTLEEVINFESITLNGKKINFIDNEYAIIGIIAHSGLALYYNPYINYLYGSYDYEKNLLEQVLVTKLMFGDNYISYLEKNNISKK